MANLLASSPPRDGLAAASWALTFWICAACSLRLAVRALISFCCCVLVASSHSRVRVKGRVVEEIVRNQFKPSPDHGDRVSVFVPWIILMVG
jgi:hypothetical protein